MKKKQYMIKLSAFILLAMVNCSWASPGDAHARDPFEPVVTGDESSLLNTAMDIAQTNSAQAVRMLEEENGSEASAALDFAIGNLYFQDEELAAAAQAYEAAIGKLPKFRSAVMNLGRVYLLQERTDETIALYQDLVQDGQADADIYLLLGHALLMEDHPVSAETAYRQSLLLHPGHTEAMLGTAKALIRQERYREGLALVGEILRQEPMNRELWSLRVNAYLAAGEHEKAMQAVELARRLDCANAEMLATLGDLHLHRDQPGDALSAYEQAFEDEQPAATRMLRAAEGFLLTGDAKSAERMLTRAEEVLAQQPEMDPDTTRALLRLQGTLAQQTGDMDAAVKQYEEILRLDPLDAETMLLLADIRHDQGQLEEAVMTLERAARVKGFEADALVRQAQIEVERERYGRAVELLESAQAFRDQPHVARYLEQVRRLAR